MAQDDLQAAINKTTVDILSGYTGAYSFANSLDSNLDNGNMVPNVYDMSLVSNKTDMAMVNSSLSESMTENMTWDTMPVGEAIVSSSLQGFFIFTTVFGNILVVMSVFTYKPLRNVQNFLIVSLACADMCVATLVMPFNVVYNMLGYWTFGMVFCQLWLTMDVLCCTASILNLCAIGLDRYWAIHDPINYAQKRTLGRVMFMILMVWGLSGMIAIPPLVGWNNWPDVQNERMMICALTDEKGYVIYSASGSFFVPLFILSIVYLKIFLATRERLRKRAMAGAAMKITAASIVNNHNTECSSSESPEETKDTHVIADDNSTALCINKRKYEHLKDSPNRCHNGSTQKLNPKQSPKTFPQKSNLQIHKFLEERAKISLSKERRAARTLGFIGLCRFA
ncbi:unnamed protein product [Owenia fusiformis]|uniref:Uncharacterized protein n=1 Tax=Owenia fusiformis TaxID=6347 RepID=A0A8J1T635_OWEFU|nr:unnamed protein product [Owenia fusiformis]